MRGVNRTIQTPVASETIQIQLDNGATLVLFQLHIPQFPSTTSLLRLTNMFKKPLAHQSNATPIRSSARRALLTDIISSYPLLSTPKSRDNATIEEVGERDKVERELGRLIMPEGIRSCSFETSGGIEGVSFPILWSPGDQTS